MLGRLTQLPPREQIGLGLACAFAMFALADQVVIKRVTQALDAMDVDIEVARKEVDHDLEVLRYEKSIEGQYEQVKNLIGVANTDDEAIEAFKSSIDEMALKNGISLKSMQHLAPERSAFIGTYYVEIGDFEAEILALINFLNDIQRSPGMLRVQKLSLVSQAENTQVKGSLVISKVMTLAGEEE